MEKISMTKYYTDTAPKGQLVISPQAQTPQKKSPKSIKK